MTSSINPFLDRRELPPPSVGAMVAKILQKLGMDPETIDRQTLAGVLEEYLEREGGPEIDCDALAAAMITRRDAEKQPDWRRSWILNLRPHLDRPDDAALRAAVKQLDDLEIRLRPGSWAHLPYMLQLLIARGVRQDAAEWAVWLQIEGNRYGMATEENLPRDGMVLTDQGEDIGQDSYIVTGVWWAMAYALVPRRTGPSGRGMPVGPPEPEPEPAAASVAVAEAAPPADQSAYVSAVTLWKDRFRTYREFQVWLSKHREIRVSRRNGNHLWLHAGDFHREWGAEQEARFENDASVLTFSEEATARRDKLRQEKDAKAQKR